MGIARKTPSAAVKRTNGAVTHHDRCTPSTNSSAPNAVPSVAPVEYPAPEAVDCMQLFSRTESCCNRFPVIARKAFHVMYESTHAVMVTGNDQPIFRVV